jgi:hypothetical protein
LSKNRVLPNSDKIYFGSFYLKFFDKNGNDMGTL